METKIYKSLPKEALDIRMRVFVDEQGFTDEVDEIDGYATHILLVESGTPIATCRIFKGENDREYFFGRLAVLKEYRGKGIGRELLLAAENEARALGGSTLSLHSQCTARDFYQKCGYSPSAEIDSEQGVAHVWMSKKL